jgi:rfaE bifunctional protein kinase chain/domain
VNVTRGEGGFRRLLDVIGRFGGRRVLVLADLVADEFLYGRVERVSREAPVLILQYAGTDVRLGGGANAIHNIKSLGAEPLPLGVVGRDDHGGRLRKLLKAKGISTSRVLVEPSYVTPVKTRILAGGVHSTKQQMVRIDKETHLESRSPSRRRALALLRALPRSVDAILVSDYGFGLLDTDLVDAAIAVGKKRGIPVTVDSRFDLMRFRGMTAVTPNESEVEAALGLRIGNASPRLETAGRRLLKKLQTSTVLVTRGSDGMALFETGRPTRHIPIFGTDQVADVTGAGDTVIATFTLALAAGASPLEASLLANFAGGIVVMKRGTATVGLSELERAVRGSL